MAFPDRITSANILAGPSKSGLENSLFAFHPKAGRFPVTFTIPGVSSPQIPIEVIIDQVGWNGGSGEEWIFKGFIPGTERNPEVRGHVEGEYNTRTRTGIIRIAQRS